MPRNRGQGPQGPKGPEKKSHNDAPNPHRKPSQGGKSAHVEPMKNVCKTCGGYDGTHLPSCRHYNG